MTANSKSARKPKTAATRVTEKSAARTIKYHPLSTPESREKWRKAIRTVLAREQSSEYKTK